MLRKIVLIMVFAILTLYACKVGRKEEAKSPATSGKPDKMGAQTGKIQESDLKLYDETTLVATILTNNSILCRL